MGCALIPLQRYAGEAFGLDAFALVVSGLDVAVRLEIDGLSLVRIGDFRLPNLAPVHLVGPSGTKHEVFGRGSVICVEATRRTIRLLRRTWKAL